MILPKAIFSDGSRVRSSSSRRWRAAIALWNAATSRIRKKPRRKIGRQHETKRRQEGQQTLSGTFCEFSCLDRSRRRALTHLAWVIGSERPESPRSLLRGLFHLRRLKK